MRALLTIAVIGLILWLFVKWQDEVNAREGKQWFWQNG
jgi:hypothetical protein